jgi:signal transduction histidine kinase
MDIFLNMFQEKSLRILFFCSAIIIVLATFFVRYVKKLYRSIESDQHQVNAVFETARKVSERELLNRQQQLEKITEEMRHLNTDLEAKVEQRTAILREALRELEKSQEELSEALSKEKELGEIKSRFVSMASHEFRTPLSTILSSATLLSRYTTTEEQGKRDKHIKRTRDAVKQLDVLLEDFLSVGRL